MKTRKQTHANHGQKTYFLLLFLLTFALLLTTTNAQDDPDNTNELQSVSKVSGSGGGGGLNVSKLNGSVSYSYPISQQSIGGHSLTVSLNYNGSVSHNSFKYYDFEYDMWGGLNKVSPEWMLSVNGFVVQTLSTAIQFYSQSVTSTPQYNTRWVVEGYDFCNSMNNLSGSQPDIIKILRDDGSVLELKNIYRPNDIPHDSLKRIGRYYSNAVNDKSYGYVHFDTTSWPSYISPFVPYEHPRLLHYYPGDGLEYIFREHIAPYGIHNYSPLAETQSAAPMIFYLEEIRSGEQSVSKFTYSRHYPTETNIDSTINRAMISEFQGHRISINNAYMTIEALGRTFKVRYKSTWTGEASDVNADSVLYPVGLVGGMGTKNGTWQNYADNTFDYAVSSCGFVTEIFDPLNRATQFDYVISKKVYDSPFYSGSLTMARGRLIKISDLSGYTTIDYHEGNGAVDSVAYLKNKLVYAFHTMVGSVNSYNSSNKLLMRKIYNFDNNPGGVYNRKTAIINYDSIAGLRDTSEYFYTYQAIEPYMIYDEGHPHDEDLSWTPLVKAIRYSPLGTTTVVNRYADDTLTGSRFMFVPVERTVSFKPRLSSVGVTTTHHKMEYEFTDLHDFDADPTFATLMARGIAKQKTIEFYPHSDTASVLDTLFTTVSEYDHLQESIGNISRTDTIWDYKRSWFVTDSLRALGIDTTALIYQTNAITSCPTIAPPIWGLLSRSFVIKSGDTLAGIMNHYQTSLLSSAPRGSLLSDTLRGSNGVKQLGAQVTYRGGWYRNFPIASTDINGSKSEILFDYSAAPDGIMVATDNQRYTRRLFNIRNEYEMSVGGRSIVRKPAGTLGGIVNDTLLGFAEFDYYGSAIGSIDANGFYSASEYDNAGRSTIGWQSYDFSPDWNTRTDRIRLYDTKTIRKTRSESLHCFDTSYSYGSWSETVEPTRLYCYKKEALLTPDNCDSMTIKLGTTLHQSGKITYTASMSDRMHNGVPVSGVTLSMFITILNICYDPGTISDSSGSDWQSIRVSIPRLGFSDTYIFGANDSLLNTRFGSISPFNIDLPDGVVDSLVAMAHGDTISILIEPLTSEQEFEILTLADDLAPAFVVNGTTSFPREEDFTAKIIYNDTTLSETAYAKIDDSYHTSNENYNESSVSLLGRYVGGSSEYVPTTNSQRSIGFFGNPYTPARLDTVETTTTGIGIELTAKDPEGRTVQAKHNFAQSKDTVYNTDGTFVISTRLAAPPSAFGFSDQNFYGLCKAQYGTDEKGIISASYIDAMGKLRRTVSDVNGLALTVRYEYDLMGRISKIISPKGDTTKYWYDNWGNIRAVYQPDIGTTSYAYDKTGQVRFIQTDRQVAENKLSFIQYDDFGRVTLTGEAKLSTVLIASYQNYTSIYPTPTSAPRLTDALGGDTLHTSTGTLPPVTVNTSLYVTPVGDAPPTLPIDSDTTNCLPSPATPLTYEIGHINSPFLKREANYWLPANAPACDKRTFENASIYPENVLQAVSYDFLPQQYGTVWAGFPTNELWDSLAPTGIVRHLRGRTAAVAYRQNNAQPFHYQVYSYDERGRVEALIRFTENLGFEAVYYTYNNANMPILVRTADPFNQHAVWYNYDDNGRIDSVYSSLTEGQGVGWTAAKRPAVPLKPLDPDTWISYARRGYADTVFYATEGGTAKIVSHLDIRDRLDTMKADVAGTDVFVQNMGYDAASNITRRTEGGTSTFLTYDNAYRLTKEVKGVDTTAYLVDNVSKRLSRKQGNAKDTLFYSGNKLTEHRRVLDTTTYARDSEGAVAGMNTKTAGTSFIQKEVLEYDAAGMTTRYKVKVNAPVGGCFPRPITLAYDSVKDWRYRGGASGLREQRRLYYSPQGDSCACLHEWTYYLRGAGDEVRAVWSGRQNADPDACGNTERRVVYYPMEYMGAGGADYVRDGDGNWVKEFRITDYLGSVRSAVRATGNVNIGYGPYGKPSTTTDRWSYLGQEKDKETVGLSDFDYRKYQSETGSFLRPDPLWSLAPGVSSFVYGNSSPLVYSDPSGLSIVSAVVSGVMVDDNGDTFVEYTLTGDANPLSPGRKTTMSIRLGPKSQEQGTDGWRKIPEPTFPPEPSTKPKMEGNQDGGTNQDGNVYTSTPDKPHSSRMERESKGPGIYGGANGPTPAYGIPDGGSESPESKIKDPFILGPGLIVIGQPLYKIKPKGVAGSAPGSSYASKWFGKLFPQSVTPYKQGVVKASKKLLGEGAAITVNRLITMYAGKTIGRVLGRLTPGVGWALTAYDIYDNREDIIPFFTTPWANGSPARIRMEDGTIEYVCFKAGTQIAMRNGLKPIEKISIGDSVYSYNLEKNIVELTRVEKSFKRNTKEIYVLTTKNQTIFVTGEHPFYVVGKGWVKVKNLYVNCVLKTKDNSEQQIITIKKIKRLETVYNIEVEGNHNYFITTSYILVHNK